MNNIQNINQNIASTIATQTSLTQESQTQATKEVAPILGGQSVTVTSAPTSDLEKLVARLKNENDDMKASVAQRRLASVLDVYTARYGELSAQQTQILSDITENNAEIEKLTTELQKLIMEKGTADLQEAVMQAKIDALEKAIAQAVKDGETHRKNVAKLKEQIAEDQDNEDLKAELEKEEKALETSEAALSKAQTDLATALAAAGALSAKIEALAGAIETKKSGISALEADNAALAAQLGSKTIANLLAAFSENEPEVEAVERGPSHAKEEKAELKAIANDPANLIREAMDRMDESILRTIDENRDQTV